MNDAEFDAAKKVMQQVHLWLRDHAQTQYDKDMESVEIRASRPTFAEWAADKMERDHAVWTDGAWSDLVHKSRREGAEIALVEARRVAPADGSANPVLNRIANVAGNIKAFGLSLIRP